jgi:MFS family permease
MPVRDAIRSRRFISLYAACLICSFGVFVPFVHLVPYAGDHGVAASTAVLLLGVIGVGSTAGRFFLGGLADRTGRQASLVAMFGGMALSLAIWLVATNVPALAVFAFAYGIFYGGWVAVLPAVVMDYFGGRNVSGLIGILTPASPSAPWSARAPPASPSISPTTTPCRSWRAWPPTSLPR